MTFKKYHDDGLEELQICSVETGEQYASIYQLENGERYYYIYQLENGERYYYIYRMPEPEERIRPKVIHQVTLRDPDEIKRFFGILSDMKGRK